MSRSLTPKTFLILFFVVTLISTHSQAVSMDSSRRHDHVLEPEPLRKNLLATAEFEPTEAVLLVWDDDNVDFVSAVIVALIHTVEIYILVQDLSQEVAAREHLSSLYIDPYQVAFITTSFDSIWIRDYGPISVRLPNGRHGIVDNEYSRERPLDDVVSISVAHYFDIPVYHSGIMLDGGNFLTNGNGLCVMTRKIEEENLTFKRPAIRKRLNKYFGCDKTIFLEKLTREKTGHIDVFAKFISPQTILVGAYDTAEDQENAQVLNRNAKRLEKLKLKNGETLSVVRIPMGSNNDGIFRSFVNSLYVNGTLVMPTYSNDRGRENRAMEVYKNVLPTGTRIATVDATEFIELEGAVHCITQSFNYSE